MKMIPHYWIEVGAKKIAVFALAVVFIATFWSILPSELRAEMGRHHPRGIANLPFMMFVGWLGGWFMLLFVRAEDLHVTAPIDIQGLVRLIAGAMIVGALAIAGFFSIAFII